MINGPLFLLSPGRYLTRRDVVCLLTRCLPNVAGINTHSFRIGGASEAASAGIPDSQIQVLGRWSSDANRRYLHFSESQVYDLCLALASAHVSNRVWDSLAGVSLGYS